MVITFPTRFYDYFAFCCVNPCQVFAVIVAAACHDVEHIGYNNNFMINSNHKVMRTFLNPLISIILISNSLQFALRYNDNSVMENHHAAFVFFATKYSKNKDPEVSCGTDPCFPVLTYLLSNPLHVV